MKDNCFDCKFYVPASFNARHNKIAIDYGITSNVTGECRRYPPKLLQYNINDCNVEYFGFSIISKHTDMPFWCGEFELKYPYSHERRLKK